MTPPRNPSILLVAENFSFRIGGESARPLQYFLHLRQRNADVRLLTHTRCKNELLALIDPQDHHRLHFTPDTRLQSLIDHLGLKLPPALQPLTSEPLIHLLTGLRQRRHARSLVAAHAIDVVHEPIPISPVQPSLMYNLGAPVIIGPLNGAMTYPPNYAHRESRPTRLLLRTSRLLGKALNLLFPGKRRARILLVSNPRTQNALPLHPQGDVVTLIANAIDPHLWTPIPPENSVNSKNSEHPSPLPPSPCTQGEGRGGGSPSGFPTPSTSPSQCPSPLPPSSILHPPSSPPLTRFAYLGRLIDFKMLDLLLDAFAPLTTDLPVHLDLIGDGPELPNLKHLAHQLHLTDHHLTFTGWLPPKESAARLRTAHVFVFPSLRDCGGAAVLEAMALALPTIAANWAGPADYLGNEGAGLLLDPTPAPQFTQSLTTAMRHLATHPAQRQEMGRRARARVERCFTWDSRVTALLSLYRLAATPHPTTPDNTPSLHPITPLPTP